MTKQSLSVSGSITRSRCVLAITTPLHVAGVPFEVEQTSNGKVKVRIGGRINQNITINPAQQDKTTEKRLRSSVVRLLRDGAELR